MRLWESLSFSIGSVIKVNNKMQKNYEFKLVEPVGKNFDPDFKPYYTPKEMLSLGVFEGHYCTDCKDEYPSSWFSGAKLNPSGPDVSLNYFKVKSRLSLSEWKNKGWIKEYDPRGWFEWYMRYYLGRRIENYDKWQINRWKAFKRHEAQVQKNCDSSDLQCRPKQRQALLQWSYKAF